MPDVEITEQETRPAPPSRDDVARAWGETSAGRAPGRSAKKRQQQIQQLRRRMEAETRRAPDGRIEGELRPCTIVNFNPVAVLLEDPMRLTIPKPGTTAHHQVKMPYKGRIVVGHYCYIAAPIMSDKKPDKEPVYYSVTTGHEVDNILPIDVPTTAPRVFRPHSIACELWSQYNSPSHKLMGGLLMFDQGPHSLAKANLDRNAGRIWVPTREQMEDEGQYVYRLRETLLDEELDRIFNTQLEYLNIVLQKAHSLWAEQDIVSRKMVTDTDREWARYAHLMGYIPSLPEWVNSKIVIGEGIADLKVCSYCGKQQVNPEIYFCPGCNAPFDAFKAFMAGRHVPEGFLMMLEGDELEIVLRKLEEKKHRFSALNQAPAPPAPIQVTTVAAPVEPLVPVVAPETAAQKKARAAAEKKKANDAAAETDKAKDKPAE